MSIFVLVLSGLSEINKNIPNNIDQLQKMLILAILGLFLACFWPVIVPVWVLNGPNEYIFPISEWFE